VGQREEKGSLETTGKKGEEKERIDSMLSWGRGLHCDPHLGNSQSTRSEGGKKREEKKH